MVLDCIDSRPLPSLLSNAIRANKNIRKISEFIVFGIRKFVAKEYNNYITNIF